MITKNFDETPVKGIKIEYKFYFASKKEDIISYSNCKYSKYGPVESRNGALVGDEVQLAIQVISLLFRPIALTIQKIVITLEQKQWYT